MNYTDPKELIFQTPAQAKAFAKWYLGTSPEEASEEFEFESPEAREQHLERRFARLQVQVDDLRKVKFTSTNKTNYQDQIIFKLAKVGHNPLATIGCDKKSSRFNFKDTPLFKNRALYFGQDKDCCYTELFHSDFMTQCYPGSEGPREGELPRPRYKLYEYRITVADLLVVTSSSTFKALGLPERVLKDEWFELNFEYNIPSSSQIFGAIVKAQGLKGILYTSVRHQTKNNLVLFEENVGDIKDVAELVHESDFDLNQHEKNLGLK